MFTKEHIDITKMKQKNNNFIQTGDSDYNSDYNINIETSTTITE